MDVGSFCSESEGLGEIGQKDRFQTAEKKIISTNTVSVQPAFARRTAQSFLVFVSLQSADCKR